MNRKINKAKQNETKQKSTQEVNHLLHNELAPGPLWYARNWAKVPNIIFTPAVQLLLVCSITVRQLLESHWQVAYQIQKNVAF